jgi:hypothetical protein
MVYWCRCSRKALQHGAARRNEAAPHASRVTVAARMMGIWLTHTRRHPFLGGTYVLPFFRRLYHARAALNLMKRLSLPIHQFAAFILPVLTANYLSKLIYIFHWVLS